MGGDMQGNRSGVILGADNYVKRGEGCLVMEASVGVSSLLAQIDREVEQGRVKLYRSRVIANSQLTYCFQTVGLFRFDLPEIVLFGIDSDAVLAQIVDRLVEDSIQGGPTVMEGLLPMEYFSRSAIGFEVQHQFSQNYCDLIYSYYQLKGLERPKIVQWVFADDEGRFPWHPAADQAVASLQTLLVGNVS